MKDKRIGWVRWLVERVLSGVGAVALTLAIFLVLPLMQSIGQHAPPDLDVRAVNTIQAPPPPPAPEEEPPPPDEPVEEPPQLEEQSQPMDLSQLELALNPGIGDGLFGNIQVNLAGQIAEAGSGSSIDEIFSLAELDREPRALFQRTPTYPPELLRRGKQGTVYVVFLVDTQGKVQNPKVERSTNPGFESAALDAVRQWKFEPGTRKGEPVQFKMRIPITFNAG